MRGTGSLSLGLTLRRVGEGGGARVSVIFVFSIVRAFLMGSGNLLIVINRARWIVRGD